jgi:hypothetical protein
MAVQRRSARDWRIAHIALGERPVPRRTRRGMVHHPALRWGRGLDAEGEIVATSDMPDDGAGRS